MAKLSGTDAMVAVLNSERENFRRRVAAALYQEAEVIMGDSKQNYVPVDFGVLKDSGRVELPEWKGDTCVVTLSYGGAASAYALAVHEHLSRHSPYSWRVAKRVTFHPAGRGPKYLEKPLNKHGRGLMSRLKKRIFGGA